MAKQVQKNLKNGAFKVSIIGCGNVGATSAYALLLSGTATDLVLIDVKKEKAAGIVLDMEHSLPFTQSVRLQGTDDFAACKSSDLVVVTAGARQEPGQTRLQLVNVNKGIFNKMIPQIVAAAPDAIFLIVTNPVDVLTYEALKISRLPAGRVFGSGTILDSARLQFHISEKLKINPKSIDAYVMGEHGDSSFPVWSSANVLGKPLFDFKDFTKKAAADCYKKTKNAAYRIIHDVGYTCYSIATAVREVALAIADDTHQVFMLSTLLRDYYGHSDVCLSVPCVLGRKGITKVLQVPLDKGEQKKLAECVRMLKQFQ